MHRINEPDDRDKIREAAAILQKQEYRENYSFKW